MGLIGPVGRLTVRVSLINLSGQQVKNIVISFHIFQYFVILACIIENKWNFVSFDFFFFFYCKKRKIQTTIYSSNFFLFKHKPNRVNVTFFVSFLILILYYSYIHMNGFLIFNFYLKYNMYVCSSVRAYVYVNFSPCSKS